MIRKLLKESKSFISTNHKFIKLIFLVSFWKLIYTIILISYNINNLLIYRFDKWLPILDTLQYFWEEITINNLVRLVIIIWLIVLIWYAFLYPTWMSAGIHFLKDKKDSIWKAIWKWVNDFFAMFELNALAFSFWIYTYAITVLRLFTLWIIDNTIAIMLVIVWWLAVLFSSIFWQYAKFIIVLENKWDKKEIWVFEAIKKSIWMTINHIWITSKWWIMQIFLSIVFYFKAFIIVSVPLLLIYFLINSNISNQWQEWIIRTIWWITLIITIYIVSIIQAFFKKFWFDIYNKVKSLEEEN